MQLKCYYRQEALGVQAEEVNSKFRVSAGHGVCRRRLLGFWGNLRFQQPPVRVGRGGAATPPPPDTWVSLANQSAAPPCPGCDWARPRSLYWGPPSLRSAGFTLGWMSLQPQMAFPWA